MSAPPEKLECGVCFEELILTKAQLDCGHCFCLKCITKWSETETSCPFCKREFTKITEKKIKSLGQNKRKPVFPGEACNNKKTDD